MKPTRKRLLMVSLLSLGLSTLAYGDEQGFSPDRSYADPAAPLAAETKANTSDFSPYRSYADPAAPAANEEIVPPGFSPKKSYADPAAPAS